jgi:hypothetical protein
MIYMYDQQTTSLAFVHAFDDRSIINKMIKTILVYTRRLKTAVTDHLDIFSGIIELWPNMYDMYLLLIDYVRI